MVVYKNGETVSVCYESLEDVVNMMTAVNWPESMARDFAYNEGNFTEVTKGEDGIYVSEDGKRFSIDNGKATSLN